MVPDTCISPLGLIEEPMTHKFSLILLLWLLLVSPQLAACGELAPYPVKDSGMLAPDTAHVMWLDNVRVLFNGYTGVDYSSDDPNKVLRFRDSGYYIWDTEKGTVQRDTSLNDKGKICIHGDYWSYLRHVKGEEKVVLLVAGKKGDEIEGPYPKVHWFNPHSCRYYETKPFWIVEGHKTLPLLEEHGYLDLGTRPEPNYLTLRLEDPNPAINFYSVPAKKSFTLPVGWLEVGLLQIHYAQFSSTYLLSGLQYYTDKRGFSSAWPDDVPLKVWWLSPDGTIKKEELPKLPWSHGNAFSLLPTRKGLLLVKQSPSGPQLLGAMGGYLVQGQEVKNVVVGALRKVAISPDELAAGGGRE